MNALLPLSVACILALAACSDRGAEDGRATADADQATPDAMSDAADSATPPGPDAGAMAGDADAADADGQALGLLAAINDHEIAAARQAKEKKVDGEVLRFAEMMETEHGANQEKTQALGPSADGPDIAMQKEKGKAELDALGAKSGDAYEQAYVEAMVKGHKEALDAIDGKMLPRATREDVRQHLTQTRKAVATHLEHARKLAGGQ